MNERWIRAVWFLRDAHISSLFVLGVSQSTQMLIYSPFEQFFEPFTLYVLKRGRLPRPGRTMPRQANHCMRFKSSSRGPQVR